MIKQFAPKIEREIPTISCTGITITIATNTAIHWLGFIGGFLVGLLSLLLICLFAILTSTRH